MYQARRLADESNALRGRVHAVVSRLAHQGERPCRYSSIRDTNSRTLGATMLSLCESCSHSRTEPSQCRSKKSPFRAAPITQTSFPRHHSALSGRQSLSRTRHAIWITRPPQRTLFRHPRSLTAFSIRSTLLFMTANARHHPPRIQPRNHASSR